MSTQDNATLVSAADWVRDQLIRLIRAGVFLPGDSLPSARKLAKEEGLSPSAVVQAFRLLASAGWIETRVRRHPVVAHRLPDDTGTPARLDRARLAQAAHLLGLDIDLPADGSPCHVRVRGDSPSIQRRKRPGATLRQRRWLGQRLRATVKLAFACGMMPDELQSLLQAAIVWEGANPFGWVANPPGEEDADSAREVGSEAYGGDGAPIPPFLMRKLRQRGESR